MCGVYVASKYTLVQVLDHAITVCSFEIATYFHDLDNAQHNFEIAFI